MYALDIDPQAAAISHRTQKFCASHKAVKILMASRRKKFQLEHAHSCEYSLYAG